MTPSTGSMDHANNDDWINVLDKFLDADATEDAHHPNESTQSHLFYPKVRKESGVGLDTPEKTVSADRDVGGSDRNLPEHGTVTCTAPGTWVGTSSDSLVRDTSSSNSTSAPYSTSSEQLQHRESHSAAEVSVQSTAVASSRPSEPPEDVSTGVSTEARKLARSERKRSREKQRRSDVNSQFAALTSLLRKIEAEDFENDKDDDGESTKKSCLSVFREGCPTNRVDLIARTIGVLDRLHSLNGKRKREVRDLKQKLEEAKKALEEAATKQESSLHQPPKPNNVMMMVPMMVSPESLTGAGAAFPMTATPHPAFMPQSFFHASSHAGTSSNAGSTQFSVPMMHSGAAATGVPFPAMMGVNPFAGKPNHPGNPAVSVPTGSSNADQASTATQEHGLLMQMPGIHVPHHGTSQSSSQQIQHRQELPQQGNMSALPSAQGNLAHCA